MKNEEALRIFKANCSGCFLKDKYCKECKTHMAIEALEKQIAKKPQEKYEYMGNIGRGLNPMEYIKGYVCPTCGEWLDEFAHHCICGQAIDWSDDE